MLVHGLMASGGLNWFRVFEPLGQHFRVLAPDLRGHGRGIRTNRRFRLADCADDIAALAEQLGVASFIIVGYSLGGPVSLLVWRRHPHLVDGIVMCASGHSFVPVARERLIFTSFVGAMAGTSRAAHLATWLPARAVKGVWPASAPGPRADTMRQWAAAELRRHDWQKVMEAAHSMGTFSARRWLHEIDVPSAVVVTTADRALAPRRQRRMAEELGATVHEVDGGHGVCGRRRFAPPVVEACLSVARRAGHEI